MATKDQKQDERITELSKKVWAAIATLTAAVAGLTAWQATAVSSISDLEGRVDKLENVPVVEKPKEEPKPPPKEETTPKEEPIPIPTACSAKVGSITEALSNMSPGKVVCLRDGTYGSVTLGSGGGILAAEHPGKVTVGSISATGQNYTVENLISGSAVCKSGASNITFTKMLIKGEASAYNASGPCTWSKSDIYAGSGSGENDSTRCWENCKGETFLENRIHIADENGGHNDGFQSYAGAHGIRAIGNEYVGGLGSQGFFLKDCLNSPGTGCTNVTFNDNLIQNRPASSSGQGPPVQVFELKPKSSDPFYTGYGFLMEHNTILKNPNIVIIRGCKGEKYLIQHNLTDGINYLQDESCDINTWKAAQVTAADNSTSGKATSATQGITWDPMLRHYGPET